MSAVNVKDMRPPWYIDSVAARHLGMKREEFRRFVKSEQAPYLQIGRNIKVPGSWLARAAGRPELALRLVEAGSVYFIACGDFVKVGRAFDVATRLGELQVGNPVELTLLATLPGERVAEARLHRMLAPERARGEWFCGPRTNRVVRLVRHLAKLRES